MKVSIIDATRRPLDVVSQCAGISYGKDDFSIKRITHCMSNNHMSVFENVVITYRIEGISRACSHQLVRHRLASFVQKSQRYTKLDTTNDDWYVEPESIKNNSDSHIEFKHIMESAASQYQTMLNIFNIRPEDARYLLPEATKTDISMTVNVRQLFHILNLRLDKHAQWEIRELAEKLQDEAASYNEQWSTLMNMYITTYPHEVV